MEEISKVKISNGFVVHFELASVKISAMREKSTNIRENKKPIFSLLNV